MSIDILDLFSSSIKDIIIEFKVVTGSGEVYYNSADAIEVNTLPISTVTISPVEEKFPEEIKLSNSTLHWDFGDGTTGEGPVIGVLGDASVAVPLNKILIDSSNDNK